MKKIILSFLLLFPIMGHSQNIDLEVTGSAGGYFENSNGTISWTIGEVVTYTATSNDYLLTQGFHQGSLEVSTLLKNAVGIYNLKVYPNPVRDKLTIKTGEPNHSYRIVDINGKTVKTGKMENKTETIDFYCLPVGMYFLQIGQVETHQIIKH
jgi:hypothetical protein